MEVEFVEVENELELSVRGRLVAWRSRRGNGNTGSGEEVWRDVLREPWYHKEILQPGTTVY